MSTKCLPAKLPALTSLKSSSSSGVGWCRRKGRNCFGSKILGFRPPANSQSSTRREEWKEMHRHQRGGGGGGGGLYLHSWTKLSAASFCPSPSPPSTNVWCWNHLPGQLLNHNLHLLQERIELPTLYERLSSSPH